MSKDKESTLKTNIFLIFLLLIIIFITIFAALNPDFGQILNVKNWFDVGSLELVPFWLAVIFTMIICFIGALIPIPVPYALPISLFTIVWIRMYGFAAWWLILLLVAFAALANTMGDLVDYMIGRGTEKILSKDDPELQNRWSQIILRKPKTIPGVILLFGLTPLPDSLLMVPLGIVKYDMKKTLIWMYIGRFFHFLLIYALAGALAIDLVFGGESSEFGWIYGVIVLYIIWGIIVLMVKYKPKRE